MDPQWADSTRETKRQFRSAPDAADVLRIGNDVVDLEHPRCVGRPFPDPFAARVLTDRERAWLQEAGPADLAAARLWALWAAKEAGFKVSCKLTGRQGVFRPQRLACDLTIAPGEQPGAGTVTGWVHAPELAGPVRVEGGTDGNRLHVVAWSGREGPPAPEPPPDRLHAGLEAEDGGWAGAELASLRDRFTPEEWEGVHSLASARVRLLARERLAALLVASDQRPPGRAAGEAAGPGAIEILTSTAGQRPGHIPPRVRIAGRDRPEFDVSLSHHGRWVAWAILMPEAPSP